MMDWFKILCAGMLAFLMAGSSIALAGICEPMPIGVKVVYEENPVVDVKITDVDTGEAITTSTNEYGDVVIDWANMDCNYQTNGIYHTFRVEVLGEVQEKTANPADNLIFEFDIRGKEVPIEIDPLTVLVTALLAIGGTLGISYKAFKGKLNDKDFIEKVPKGTGIKLYKQRTGTNEVLHKHPGIRGYHNPETSHREEAKRHPAGQLFPEYDENSKYVK